MGLKSLPSSKHPPPTLASSQVVGISIVKHLSAGRIMTSTGNVALGEDQKTSRPRQSAVLSGQIGYDLNQIWVLMSFFIKWRKYGLAFEIYLEDKWIKSISTLIVSGEQWRDSAIHIRVSILPQAPLPSRLPHNIEQNSTCYTIDFCWSPFTVHLKLSHF